MTPRMNLRIKLASAFVALLLAGAAALVLAGPASASQWHLYEGDVYAGHAYGLQVPPMAESFQVSWSGPEEASASLAIFDPAGARLGHYALSSQLTDALVVKPSEGRYVLYVYELTGGALDVRVNAPAAPDELALQKLPLKREDVAIASSDAAAPLDKAVATQLPSAPVFLTLLYEGSVRGMDATVTSPKGVVATIRGESGTAFAPGVYSSLSGERRLDAANLDGSAYQVEVHAESFEGTLFLTTMAVDYAAPAAPEAPEPATQPPAPLPAAWSAPGASPTFAFEAGKAYAFHAQPGELLLADPMAEKSANASGEDHDEYSYYDVHDAISIYAPDDSLLAYVVLEHENMNVSVALPVEGEYVAYVHHAHDEVVLARLVGAAAAPALRELPLVEETFGFEGMHFLGDGEAEFELVRAPVSLRLGSAGGLQAISWASVENEAGVAASYHAFLGTPGLHGLDWSEMTPENFRAGLHTLEIGGLISEGVVLTALSYDRAGVVAPTEAVETTEPEQPGEPGDWTPPAPPSPPSPPGAPAAPAPPQVDLFGLLGL